MTFGAMAAWQALAAARRRRRRWPHGCSCASCGRRACCVRRCCSGSACSTNRASSRSGNGSAARYRSFSPSLIALALALAITRPSRRSAAPSTSRGRVLVVVDSSWSMLAGTRSGESRWDRARRRGAAACRRVEHRDRGRNDRGWPGRGADDGPGAARFGARPHCSRRRRRDRVAAACRGRHRSLHHRRRSTTAASAGRCRPLCFRVGAERRRHRI